MKRLISVASACTLVLLSCQTVRADVVTDWNSVAFGALRRDGTMPGPTWASRNLAMLHGAIFDAVNSVSQSHTMYMYTGPTNPVASQEAAAAQAAYHVLAYLYPDPVLQMPHFDAALAGSLAAIPDGPAKLAGIALGDAVGNEMIAFRANDNSHLMNAYTTTNAPGHWRPDPRPGQPTMALEPDWGLVTPFVLSSANQFAPPAVPSLTSAEYAAAFQEVRLLGDKTVRQDPSIDPLTEIGVFWGYDRSEMGPPPILYNQAIQAVASLQGNTLAENARLFALANIAQADAGIAAWDSKYDPQNDFWRPITGIREADTDGNPATLADPNWEPYGAPGGTLSNGTVIPNFTPPFPAYVSGHATFGAAAFRTLADFYGTDAVTFSLQSDELPGVVRAFNSFSEAAAENGRSRIYLGIHWSFDDLQGQTLGNFIADYVHAHALLPIPEPSVGILVTALGVYLAWRRNRPH